MAGVFRVLIKDDHFEDYYFPKGTRFSNSPNVYSDCSVERDAMDPNKYPDPTRFLPERFTNEDLDKPLAGHWSFGMGRRGA